MHSYLRAIGFSNIKRDKELEPLLKEVSDKFDTKVDAKEDTGSEFIELSKEFGPDIGITICGEKDEDGFHREYYFPYMRGSGVTTREDVGIEKHGPRDSYAGVCEDMRVGVSLIFYLQNAAEYKKECFQYKVKGKSVSTTFAGLSLQGKVLMPICKSKEQIVSDREATANRSHLIAAARKGDEEAMESLTLEDIDTYTMVSRRIQNEDVFTIVDSFFMPYGMECDQYQILGEILQCQKQANSVTGEKIFQMRIDCNGMQFDICINEKDLMGVPEEGRRFKGTVWLQGYLNFS